MEAHCWRPAPAWFVGADLLGPDDARMEFRLHGLIPVAKASGPDVTRSAAGRLAAETIAWLPQAATPQAGARWTPVDEQRATVTVDAASADVDVTVCVSEDGHLTSINLQRWNEAADPPAAAPFGAEIHHEYTTGDGVRIAGSGHVGWGHRTPTWSEGEFFHYSITASRWISDAEPEQIQRRS